MPGLLPPEVVDTAKSLAPYLSTVVAGIGGHVFGKAKSKAELAKLAAEKEAIEQKNKDSEFQRISKLLDEVQSERDRSQERLARLEERMGLMEERHAREKAEYEEKIKRLEEQRANDQDEIRQLKRENGWLTQRVSELEKINVVPKADK